MSLNLSTSVSSSVFLTSPSIIITMFAILFSDQAFTVDVLIIMLLFTMINIFIDSHHIVLFSNDMNSCAVFFFELLVSFFEIIDTFVVHISALSVLNNDIFMTIISD